MKVAGIGGGTGLPVLLRGLKELNGIGHTPIDITAIVAVSDSGGSTGALRDAFRMPAVGDIRKCLIALTAEDSLLSLVCQYRFDDAEGLAGHPVGNLILSALYRMSGDFTEAVRQAAELLGVNARVLPSTDVPVTLCARYDDGTAAEGESGIPKANRTITRVWLKPDQPEPAAGVLDALMSADVIVIGPGSLYTSIIPNLLAAGVAEAIHRSEALTIYVSNLMTQPGETDGYSAADHVRMLQSYLPARSIDVCLMNNACAGTGVAARYHERGSGIITGTLADEEEIRKTGVIPVAAPLIHEGEIKARHDPRALAQWVVSLTNGKMNVSRACRATEPEVTCAESSVI